MAIIGAAVGGATLLSSAGINVKGTINSVLGRVTNIFGLKRETKRRRRDRYVGELHAAGLNPGIGQDSDYWATAQLFSELNQELPGIVIDVLNQNAHNYGAGPEIPRRGSSQFNRVISEIEQGAGNMYSPPGSAAGLPSGPVGVPAGNKNLLILAAGAILLAITLK